MADEMVVLRAVQTAVSMAVQTADCWVLQSVERKVDEKENLSASSLVEQRADWLADKKDGSTAVLMAVLTVECWGVK